MVIVVQLVRTSDCGSEGREFESHLSPKEEAVQAVVVNEVNPKKGLE